MIRGVTYIHSKSIVHGDLKAVWIPGALFQLILQLLLRTMLSSVVQLVITCQRYAILVLPTAFAVHVTKVRSTKQERLNGVVQKPFVVSLELQSPTFGHSGASLWRQIVLMRIS